MATLRIKNRDKRLKCNISSVLHDVNLKLDVSQLKYDISQLCNLNNFDVIYCGKILKEGTLEAYNIKSGATIHIISKLQAPHNFVTEPMDDDSKQQVLSAMKSASENPSFKEIVEKIFSNPESLENIIVATPGLSSDPVAMALIRDPEMLSSLTDENSVKNIINEHPSIGTAALLVAYAVNEESTSSSINGSYHRGAYSLDQMSDDESEPMNITPSRRSDPQPITASQLAAALMSTGGSSGNPPSSSNNNENQTNSFLSPFLQDSSSQSNSQTVDSMQDKIAQLREMGIIDEQLARQALESCGGNLTAALELIFGDQSMSSMF